MLSQFRPYDDNAHSYAGYMSTTHAPRLRSLHMPLHQQEYDLYQSQQSANPLVHRFHHHHHHHHPYQRPIQSIPSLPVPPVIRAASAPVASSRVGPRLSSHKCSLAFILSEPAQEIPSSLSLQRSQSDTGASSDADSLDNDSLNRPHDLKHKRRSSGSPSTVGSKSKYCIVDGCTSRAKHARKCWRHGGSVKCKVHDCINRAKSRGVCWTHGGGTTCSHANCGTIAVSHGFCWAHGGGKRCDIGGCSRPAYERTQNLCSTHFKQQKVALKAASC